jgi:hypothetical protein
VLFHLLFPGLTPVSLLEIESLRNELSFVQKKNPRIRQEEVNSSKLPNKQCMNFSRGAWSRKIELNGTFCFLLIARSRRRELVKFQSNREKNSSQVVDAARRRKEREDWRPRRQRGGRSANPCCVHHNFHKERGIINENAWLLLM